MSDIRLRKRHRLRQKEIVSLAGSIDSALGIKSFTEMDIVDMAEGPDFNVIFVDGKILAFVPGGMPFLTVRGLLRYGATKRFITVDMGAVKFVYNGADVMGPGIVACDEAIVPGDLVWVRDVNNLKPLAVGMALFAGDAMARKEKGKAVQSIHHVGDKLWELDEPKEEE
jgi:PUA-domain protein